MTDNLQRYAHLAHTPWDRSFLSNPSFSTWFTSQLAERPMRENELLVDYVRERIELAKGENGGVGGGAAQAHAEVQQNAEEQHHEEGDVNEIFDLSGYAPDEAEAEGAHPTTTATSFPPSAFSNPASAPPAPNHLTHSSLLNHSPQPISTSSFFSNGLTPAAAAGGGSIDPSSLSGAPSSNGASSSSAASSSLQMQRELVQAEQKRVASSSAPPKAKEVKKKREASAEPTKSAATKAVKKPKIDIDLVSGSSTTKPTSRSSTPQPNSRASSATPASKPSGSSSSGAAKPPSASTSASTATNDTEDPWHKLLPHLRTQIAPTRFTRYPSSTASKLAKLLAQFQTSDEEDLGPWGDGSLVPPAGRVEVLSAMLANGGEKGGEFWKAWLGEREGMEVLCCWCVGLVAALLSVAKGGEAKGRERELKGTGGVLKVIARLPLTLDHLRKYKKIPARTQRLSLKGPEGEIKTLAATLTAQWSKMQAEEVKKVAASAPSSATAVKKEGASAAKEKEGEKKRKSAAEDANDAKKKLKSTATTKPVTAASLFPSKLSSASLSFTKKTPAPAASATSLFQEAFAAMQGKKAAAAPPAEVAGGTAKRVGKNGKKIKSVRWKPDHELEQIREIESRAESLSESLGGQFEDEHEHVKMMDGEEGQVHALHLGEEMDEEIDWYEPLDVFIPPDAEIQPPTSPAMDLETIREVDTPAFDPSAALLDSPTEPTEPYTPESTPLTIPLSVELLDDPSVQATISHAQASTTPLGGFAANEQIQTLLGQLTAGGFNAPPPQQQQQQQHWQQALPHQPAFDQATINALSSYDPELIKGIVASNPALQGLESQLGQLGVYGEMPRQDAYGAPPPPNHAQGGYDPYAPPNATSYASAWNNPGPQQQQYGGYVPPPPSFGQGPPPQQQQSRGERMGVQKGRRKMTVPCKFFNHPKGCDRGDACPFIHDRNARM